MWWEFGARLLPPGGNLLIILVSPVADIFFNFLSITLQIEETRQNIDKISENVEEAKKLYSIILSAPIPEQSE